MPSFLNLVSAPALQKLTERHRFGAPYVRLGPLFISLGAWLFQMGGALGYGLKEHHVLLGKLLVVNSEPGDLVQSLRSSVERYGAHSGRRTFFHLYTIPGLRTQGIELDDWPPSKKLDEKWNLEMVSTVMHVSFSEGAAFGFHFPDLFRDCWEEGSEVLTNAEHQDSRAKALGFTDVVPMLSLEASVLALAEAARVWSADEAPWLLTEHEVQVLEQLQVMAAITTEPTPTTDTRNFCHKCGAGVQPTDSFCVSCETRM